MQNPRDAAVLVDNVHKRFGDVHALRGISFAAQRGSVLGVLGPNGAGKTTTVKVLSTLLSPDEGTAHVAGFDVVKDAAMVRRSIMMTGQYAALDETLSGRANVELFGRLMGLRKKAARQRADELIEEFDLTEAARRPVSGYSGGMRRRIDIACGLVVRPSVVFLDEPTTGLDPRSRQNVWMLVESLKRQGITVLLTTQYLEEADNLSDNIIVIDRGTVIAEGTADELKAMAGGSFCEIVPTDPSDLPAVIDALGGMVPVAVRTSLAPDARSLAIPAPDGTTTLTETVRRLDQAGIDLEDIGLRRPSLDDVFLRFTGTEQVDPEALQNAPTQPMPIVRTARRSAGGHRAELRAPAQPTEAPETQAAAVAPAAATTAPAEDADEQHHPGYVADEIGRYVSGEIPRYVALEMGTPDDPIIVGGPSNEAPDQYADDGAVTYTDAASTGATAYESTEGSGANRAPRSFDYLDSSTDGRRREAAPVLRGSNNGGRPSADELSGYFDLPPVINDDFDAWSNSDASHLREDPSAASPFPQHRLGDEAASHPYPDSDAEYVEHPEYVEDQGVFGPADDYFDDLTDEELARFDPTLYEPVPPDDRPTDVGPAIRGPYPPDPTAPAVESIRRPLPARHNGSDRTHSSDSDSHNGTPLFDDSHNETPLFDDTAGDVHAAEDTSIEPHSPEPLSTTSEPSPHASRPAPPPTDIDTNTDSHYVQPDTGIDDRVADRPDPWVDGARHAASHSVRPIPAARPRFEDPEPTSAERPSVEYGSHARERASLDQWSDIPRHGMPRPHRPARHTRADPPTPRHGLDDHPGDADSLSVRRIGMRPNTVAPYEDRSPSDIRPPEHSVGGPIDVVPRDNVPSDDRDLNTPDTGARVSGDLISGDVNSGDLISGDVNSGDLMSDDRGGHEDSRGEYDGRYDGDRHVSNRHEGDRHEGESGTESTDPSRLGEPLPRRARPISPRPISPRPIPHRRGPHGSA